MNFDITVLYLQMANINDKVINAALKLAQLKGWENVSVRMLAKEIGYSTMKIYSDFGSKEQLLFEIQKKGFTKLDKIYKSTVSASKAPEVNLEGIVLAHVRFALDHPTYYELMFDHKFNDCKTKAATIKQQVGKIFFDVVASIGVADPKTAFLQIFAMLYGYIKMSTDLADHEKVFKEATIKQMVQNFIHGIK
ncbi:MAG TPA: hypothetical protein DCS93_03665 [Microscillaceae bacterium]|nr:hypothetical protein [Microscillaceae bacterium]